MKRLSVLLPTFTPPNPCAGKEHAVEMHHSRDCVADGDNNKIKGVGEVLEQDQLQPDEEAVLMPTFTPPNPCSGREHAVELHHSHGLVSGGDINKTKDVGEPLEQDQVQLGEEAVLLPTFTPPNPCTGKGARRRSASLSRLCWRR